MSWDVSLVEHGKKLCVEKVEAGGTYCIGGSDKAELNITYNYSKFYYKYLNTEEGLKWLDGKKAKKCIASLKKAVDILGTYEDEDYWKPTPGNAGKALSILLTWAEKYPEATFKVY